MLILLIKVFIAQSSCIEVECQDTPDPQSRCIEVTQTIKVAGCPAGMYCPSYSSISNYNETSQILDVYCEYLPYNSPVDLCGNLSYTSTQIPGDSCCTNSNCNTGICTDFVCVGLSSGAKCSDSTFCAPGLYCSNFLCTSALTSGILCSSDLECQIGYGCSQKHCTKL